MRDLSKMINEIAKMAKPTTAEEAAKAAGKFSKEARQFRKIQKLGAVSARDFENLSKTVQLQKYGFLAIGGIEVFRIITEGRNNKKMMKQLAEMFGGEVNAQDLAESVVGEAFEQAAQQTVEEPVPEEPQPDQQNNN